MFTVTVMTASRADEQRARDFFADDYFQVCRFPQYQQQGGSTADILIYYCDRFTRMDFRNILGMNKTDQQCLILWTNHLSDEHFNELKTIEVNEILLGCEDWQDARRYLELAWNRFQQGLQLQQELYTLKEKLMTSELINKAKTMLMMRNKINEDQAYQFIYKLASDTNREIVDVSKEILALRA